MGLNNSIELWIRLFKKFMDFITIGRRIRFNIQGNSMNHLVIAAAGLLLFTATASGQQSTEQVIAADMLGHFQRSSFKVSALAEEIPDELYAWAPMEGAMTVGKVFAHIARYNYYYLESSLGIPAPDGVNLDTMEMETDKDTIVGYLQDSITHARKAMHDMSEDQLTAQVTLYGRQVEGWRVLTQLVVHLNEHVGQAVSYARMNEIVPPWSR